MTNQPFSFLHAADLHLERPVTGLAECPEHLLEGVLSAAQRAAERLFHTAITEKVDFVLLCGDILSLRQTGPWGAVFLLDQFERLRREGIAVYWIGGFADPPSEWPEVLALPDNVTLFPEDEVTGVIHRKGTDAVARVLGTSRGKNNSALRLGDFTADPDGLYTIGMMRDYGSYDTLRACGPHYWALGGTHRRDTSVQGHVTIHNPGATLARCPEDGENIGASLVTVDETGRTVIKPVKTSPVRWATERLVFREEQDEEFIASAMRTRLSTLRKSMGDEILFVAWVFEVPPALATELRYGNLSQSLLRGIRADFGREAPLIWSTKIDPVALDDEGDEGERQTILGDYLRMIRFYKENPGDNIPLSDYFPDELKEYLAVHMAQRQRQDRAAETEPAAADANQPETLAAPQIDVSAVRTFRPEAAELARLLTIDPEESRLYRPVSESEKNSPRYRQLCDELARRRDEALGAAAMLGRELLIEEAGDLPTAPRAVHKRAPLLTEEHKAIESCPNGKDAHR